MLSLSVHSASVSLPFVRFPSASGYLAFCFFLSSFFLSPPHSGFLSAPLPLSLLWLSPFLPTWFPVSSLPVLRTRLPVRFLSSFPVSLPQPFHRCFPYAFAFGLSPRSNFLSSVFRSVLTTQPSALSFPFFPFSPVGGSSGASFLFRPACFHAFLPIPVLSFLHFFSPLAVSPHSGYLSALAFSLSVPGLFPLAFALGSGYLALECIPYRYLPAASFLFSLSDLTYTIMLFFDCQHLFSIFY